MISSTAESKKNQRVSRMGMQLWGIGWTHVCNDSWGPLLAVECSTW